MALLRLARRLASVPFPILPYPISDSRRRLLLSFSTSSSTPPHFMVDYLVSACGLSPAEAARAAPLFSHLSSTARLEAALAFLRSQGLCREQIRAIVSRKPALLLSNVDATLSPKFSAVRALGLSRSEVARLFAGCPSALTYGIRTSLLPRISFWLDLLGSTRLLMKCLHRTWMLKFSVDQLLQNLSTLRGLGVPDSRVTTVLRLQPSIIMLSSAKFQTLLDRVEAQGFSPSHGMYMWSVFALHNTNDRTFQAKKAGVIRVLGCSEQEFAAMSRSKPCFMSVTEETMRSKVEFLKTVVGCSSEYIIRNPVMLTLSIEKRMAPRCRAIETLRSKGIDIGKQSMINTMRLSKAKFVEKYILKYKEEVPELLELYQGQGYLSSSPSVRLK